jgi:exonuclease I
MKETNPSPEVEKRIRDWMFVLIMRLYSQNIYSDESYVWQVYDSETVDQVDKYFEGVLSDFKYKHSDIARLYKILQKNNDILSR